MGELAHCVSCGEVFVKTLRDICHKCAREEEKMYRKVYNFLRVRENRSATLQEVHEKTGVPEETIVRFVKEGRIRTGQLENLTYPCESCGEPITMGRLCRSCVKTIESDLEKAEQEEKRQAERKRTYFANEP